MPTPCRIDRPARCPTHPGELLREILEDGLKLSVAARHLGVSRMTLHRLLRGEQAVTPEMALRLGKLCGNGPELWLRMQMAHDLWLAERTLQPRPHPDPPRGVRQAPAPASIFPVDRLASGYDAIWQASAKNWTSLLLD